MRKRTVVLALAGTLLLTPQSYAQGYVKERQQFVAAHKALRRGDLGTFSSIKASLEDYPLYRYLEFEDLNRRARTGNTTSSEIKAFISSYPDSFLSDRLLHTWLRTLAKHNQWNDFLELYPGAGPESLKCYQLKARHALGQLDTADTEIESLWLKGTRQPAACEAVFKELEKTQAMSPRLMWERVYLAMERGNIKLAKELARNFGPRDRAWVTVWIDVHKDPETALEHPTLAEDSLVARKIFKHGIIRLTKSDPEVAWDRWKQLRGRYSFSRAQLAEVDRYIALAAAYRGLPRAEDWLKAVDQSLKDERVRAWKARSALRNQDWAALLGHIGSMPAHEREEDQWRYWEARALEALGKQARARELYQRLSQKTGYYGFLSADRIGEPYAFTHEALEPDSEIENALQNRPRVVRARELYSVGRHADARREWNQALKVMSDVELQTAAVLASSWGWHDRAVYTVARAGHRNDFELRFPMPYREQISNYATRKKVEPAWIYGVIRRESAYMSDVRSGAGAVGLMQLMPATANEVARRLGKRIHTRDLIRADLNIELGTTYLRQVLEAFGGHQILATAAYNAGPNRVKRWLPNEGSIPADVWIDTIPYTETRRYVRAVMTYTTIFEWRMKRLITPLRERMAVIEAPSVS